METPDEESLLRSSALQNANAIQLARRRAEQSLVQRTEELAQSLSMMRATLEASTDGIMVTDEKGHISHFNEKALGLWGISPNLADPEKQQELRATISSQVKDPEKFMARALEIYASWPPETFDLLELVDGRVFERRSKAQGSGGKNRNRVWSFRDITDRRLAEEKLRQQQEWFRVTLSSIGDAVITTDTQAKVSYLNPVAEKMTGWKSTEAAGRPLEEVFRIINEITREPAFNPVNKVLRDGAIVGPANHTALIARDGSEIAIEDSAAPIWDGAGKIGGVVMVFHDVGERRKTELALQVSHAQFAAIINQSPVGIYLLDSRLHIRHVNPKAIPVFGGQTHLIGRDWVEVIYILWPPDVAAELVNRFRHTLQTGESYFGVGFSSERADRAGKEYYDWEIHRVTLTGGEFGIAVYFKDISAHVLAQEALRESEERLRASFNQAAVGMATADLNGKFEQANQRMAAILGYTSAELCERTFMDITHPADRASTGTEVRRLLAGEIPHYALEKRYLRKDGTIVWSRTTVTLLKDSKGQPFRFIGIIEEITERKQSEQAISEAASRLDLALAAGELGDWSWTAATDEVIFGPRGRQIFGLAPDTVITWTQLRDYLHEDDRERARLAVEQSLAARSPYSIEYRICLPAGEQRWVTAKGHGIYAADGTVTGMTGVVQDITKRKDVEEALREEYIITEQLNDVARALATELDLAKIVQMITDAGTRITRAQFGAFFYNVLDENGASYMLYALSGVPREAFSKFPMPRATALFGPTFRGEGVLRLADVRKDHRFGHSAPYHGMPPGHLPVVSYLAVSVTSRSGKVLGGLFFGHSEPNIFTERDEKIIVGVASQAAAAMDTARAYQAEQQARTAAEQANQAKDHFLAALSHELRTPLTPVLALLSHLCKDSSVPESLAHDLETMRRNVELEARLIDDLLDLTRITRGKLELHLAPVSVGQLIEDAIDTCQPDLKARRLNLIRHVENPQRTLSVDGARITQILWNLLKNSIKFTSSGGSITVRARVLEKDANPQLVIEIQDTGKGIEPEHLQRLFNAFEQGDRQITRQFGGLGLGLAISKAIAESHHGTLTAASAGPGHGSTFTLTLPFTAAVGKDASLPHPSTDSLSKTPPQIPTGAQLRILLVEDHIDTAKTLSTLLQRRGYLVTTAVNVTNALKLAETQPFDLLLSDLGLPDATGFDLMSQIRDKYSFPGIALSGYGMEEDVRRCREAGFSEHLVKPVRIAQLDEALARVLARK